MSKSQDIAIYVDGEYQGNGYVRYSVPKGATTIKVSYSVNGLMYDYRDVYIDRKLQYVDINIKEHMTYGVQSNQIKQH